MPPTAPTYSLSVYALGLLLCATGCPQASPRAEAPLPAGSACSSNAIACYDELARQPGDLICFRPTSRWGTRTLTWALINTLPGGDPAEQSDAARRAFAAWDEASALELQQVEDPEDADIVLSFVEADHGDPYPFPVGGSVLAHAYFPGTARAGDVHLYMDKEWSPPHAGGRIDLFAVALHEIGHALGLEHVRDADAVMAPVYHADGEVVLTAVDVAAIQRLYGSADGSVEPVSVLRPGACAGAPGDLVGRDEDGGPENPDSDGDGVPDTIEVFIFDTDPFDPDTDGDGVDDRAEVFVNGTPPAKGPSPGDPDADEDQLPQMAELDLGTDPNDSDSDDDGLLDGAEVFFFGTIPTSADTDGDRIEDGQDPFPNYPFFETQPPATRDCNENGVFDAFEISDGDADDCNGNLRPDECDIGLGASEDVDEDGVPDECDASGCDDDDPCTVDGLAAHGCVHVERNCSDGRFCNGAEQCTGGDCVSPGDPCVSRDLRCDEANHECVACLTGDDCVDDRFCNGRESCVEGECLAGTSPCPPSAACDESADSCVSSPPPPPLPPDCNANGIPDTQDLQNGTSDDCNQDGVPDECQQVPPVLVDAGMLNAGVIGGAAAPEYVSAANNNDLKGSVCPADADVFIFWEIIEAPPNSQTNLRTPNQLTTQYIIRPAQPGQYVFRLTALQGNFSFSDTVVLILSQP
jgi:hypothetical protein